ILFCIETLSDMYVKFLILRLYHRLLLNKPSPCIGNIMKYNVFLGRHFTKCIMQRLVLG
uniref:Uncharacterized protein n=1 Tax=Neovison vison TaxID=452646 RepID=A0A8C7B530_NEOVI